MSLIDDFEQQESKSKTEQFDQTEMRSPQPSDSPMPGTQSNPAIVAPPTFGQQVQTAVQSPIQNLKNMFTSHVQQPMAQMGTALGQGTHGIDLQAGFNTPAGHNILGQGLTSVIRPEMMALGALNVVGRVMPSLGKLGVLSKLTEYLSSSNSLHTAFSKFESSTGAADYEAHEAWKKISGNLGGDELKRLVHLIEHPGSEEVIPTPKESEALHSYKMLIKPYSDLAVKEGIIPEAKENYLKHIYQGKLDEMNTYANKIPGQQKKVWETYTEADKFLNEQKDLVKQKGLTEEQVLKMSPDQLKQAGMDPRINRWLTMKPIYDPGLSLAATIKSVRQTLNVRQLVSDLSEAKDTLGRHIFEPDGHGNSNYMKLETPGNMLNKYIAVASKKTPNGRLTTLVDKPITVLKQYAPLVDRLLRPTAPQGMVRSAITDLSGLMKQAIFYNPLVHTVNELSATLAQTRGNIPGALGMAFKGSKLGNDAEFMKEAISNGLITKNVDDASKALRQAFQEIPKKMNIPMLSAMNNKVQSFNDKTLWTYVNNLSLGLYDYNKSRLLKAGYTLEQAGRSAAEVTNTALGNITKRHLNELIGSKDFWESATMIPKWIATQSKPWLTQLMPKEMLKGFSQPEQDIIKKEFFMHLSSGLIQRDMYNNLLNKTMSGHWSFQNSPDNIQKDRIETNMTNKRGQQITIDTGLFKNISLPKRLLANPVRFLRPEVKSLISGISQKDVDTGKQLYGKMDTVKSLFQDVNLFGTGEFMKNMKQGHSILNSAARSLSPIKEYTHIPGGPGAVKLIQLNDSLNPKKKVQYPEDPQHAEIDKFLEKGDIKGLVQYAVQNKVSQAKIDNRVVAFKQPVTYHLKQIPTAILTSGFKNLSKGEQDKLIASLKEENSPYATALEPYRKGYKPQP